jgi:hypothetical protein
MIVTPAVLVVRNNEQDAVPPRRFAYRFPHLIKELLTFRNVVGGMLIVWVPKKPRFDEGILRKRVIGARGLECSKVFEMILEQWVP